MSKVTKKEAIKMLKAKRECLIKWTRGTYEECNEDLCESCDLNYDQGCIGCQIEALQIAIDSLEGGE